MEGDDKRFIQTEYVVQPYAINGDTVDHKISDILGEHSEGSMNKADLVSRYRDKQAQVDAIIQKINYNDQHTTEINQKLMEDVVSGKDD